MPHPDEPALVAYVAENASATAIAVYDPSDSAGAAAALRAAAAQIRQIRHPDEPDDPLPNWCDVPDEDGVPVLRLDMKDEIRYAALVVRIVLDQVSAAGVDGRVAPWRPPEPPFPYDAGADLYYGSMDPLSELDRRGLPPGFPDGFPVPEEATLVLAQRARDGAAEHAAWRRSIGPFTGYLARLRGYGCTFGAVPRLLTAGTPGSVRYTVWRDGAGGSVTLHQSSSVYWYVNVVWAPQAGPPPAPVEPDEAPDSRPIPTGQAAARDLARFLVPAELVPAYEAVVALATAARELDRLADARPDPADRRPKPVVVASRFTQALGPLDPEQLTNVRHVCLTMVANLVAAGRRARPAGLTLVPDDDGLLYAADLRERARGVVEPDLMAAFEAGAVIVQGGPMVGEAFSVRTEPVRPKPERYAWLFAGLDDRRLDAARDACWRIFGG